VTESEGEDTLIEMKKKENTIWKILMPGKNRKLATEAELQVLEEIENLIEK